MILFKTDWLKYPTAQIHYGTRNKSFLELAAKYREMGIKNHAFILALIDPHLANVDPHSPHITLEQMLRVSAECKENPWYFFREVAMAPARGGTDPTHVEGNRANICLWWCFFNHIDIFLIQPRQTGKSFSTDVLMSLLLNITCVNTEINLISKDDSLRRANVERLKDIIDDLPHYLNQRTKEDTNNGEEITIKRLGNVYKTNVPQGSPKAALKLGRGLTTAITHWDEPPFQSNVEIAMGAALGATGAARDAAKAANAPYGNIFTTTAGKKDDRDGKFIYKLLMDSAVWSEHFFDSENEHDLRERIKQHSRDDLIQINATFSHRQLGKTDEWLREKIRDAKQSGDDANRDFFNLWTSGSASSPFEPSVADFIANGQLTPLHQSIDPVGGYILRWFIPKEDIEKRMARGNVIMAMDPSDAGGGDDISVVFLDIETLGVLAAGTYNVTNLLKFSIWICAMFVRWPGVTAIIERRGSGAAIMDNLLHMLPDKGINPFKRMFNRIVHDRDSNRDRFEEIDKPLKNLQSSVYERFKTTFGFATSASGETSRTSLYSTTLYAAVEKAGDKIYDQVIISQLLGLVIRNGRIDHPVGGHDDMVIGWLLAHWIAHNGRNLAYYGIDIGRIASKVREEVEMSPVERHQKNEQAWLRSQIDQLYQRMLKEPDETISTNLEYQIRGLERRLILEEGELFNLDQFIDNAKKERRNKLRQRSYDQSYGQANYGVYTFTRAL